MKSSGDVEALVAAAVLGKPLAEIASLAGISVSTVQRRLKEPEVVAAINETRGRHRTEALGRMTHLRTQALDRLHELLGDEDPGIALRAVTLVLTTSTRFERDYELADRVAALESGEEPVRAEATRENDDVS
jgi:DNA-binding Lrp family transcriptional regulator